METINQISKIMHLAFDVVQNPHMKLKGPVPYTVKEVPVCGECDGLDCDKCSEAKFQKLADFLGEQQDKLNKLIK